jgi:glycosyltransferase involved in cell wall biosynthesis
MQLVLDARTATDHFPGIGRYTFSLAQAMAPLLNATERLTLVRDPSEPSSRDLAALAGEQVHVTEAAVSPFSLAQQWRIPGLLRRLACDLYHSPYYLMPYWPRLPTVVTVYDLIPLLFPQVVSARARLLFRWATALALRAATCVIVTSEATRRDLLRTYQLPSGKVAVIPLAADTGFHPQGPAQIKDTRRRYDLPERYALYLGINKPHKNLERLVEAWHRIAQPSAAPSRGAAPILVIAGAWDVRYPECRQRVQALCLDDDVRFLGPVPEEDLPALYSAAMLFVFPSLYEGFGLPVLEAMACGTPVVCSDTSSLPEIVGQAALTFDPLDPAGMAAEIEAALYDEARREKMREKGLERALEYSWTETARRTLRVYRRGVTCGGTA